MTSLRDVSTINGYAIYASTVNKLITLESYAYDSPRPILLMFDVSADLRLVRVITRFDYMRDLPRRPERAVWMPAGPDIIAPRVLKPGGIVGQQPALSRDEALQAARDLLRLWSI